MAAGPRRQYEEWAASGAAGVTRRGVRWGAGGQRQVLDLDAEHLATQEENRADGLILRAGRDAPVDGQVGGEVSNRIGLDARGDTLAFGQVIEEAPDPIDVAALGPIRVVTGTQAVPELFEGREGIAVAPFVDDGAGRLALPIPPLQNVDEGDVEGVFGLADLPVATGPRVRAFRRSGAPGRPVARPKPGGSEIDGPSGRTRAPPGL